MQPKELKKLVKELRKLGIQRFREADLEIELFPAEKTIKRSRKQIKPPSHNFETIVEDQITDEALLMWSVHQE